MYCLYDRLWINLLQLCLCNEYFGASFTESIAVLLIFVDSQIGPQMGVGVSSL